MQRIVFLLLCLLSFSSLSANERLNIDVIAVDYPPYSSPKLPDYGSSFSLLNKYAQSNFRMSVKPLFLPPARANKIIQDGHWCLSFYPPAADNDFSRFVPLSDSIVSIGFYRLRQQERFYWTELNELSGKTVTLLRTNTINKLHQRFLDAGLKVVYVESIAQGLKLVLKNRVDYAFGDNLVVTKIQLSETQRQKLQFSESAVHEAKVGFFYNIKCEDKLFIKNKSN
jgi:polar amino acid transport system substrate-binding protein